MKQYKTELIKDSHILLEGKNVGCKTNMIKTIMLKLINESFEGQ
jgi:hypothetical protein